MTKGDYEYIRCFSPKSKFKFNCLLCGCFSTDIYRKKGKHEDGSKYNWLCPKCFKKLLVEKKETFIFR